MSIDDEEILYKSDVLSSCLWDVLRLIIVNILYSI
jgi:hypothetical protein